jgi:uncharacterized membrane protein YqjE
LKGSAEPGFLDALRGAGATLIEIGSARAALFAVELAEEIERRKRSMLLAACAAALLHIALVLATFLVAAIFWDSYRVAAIAAMAVTYALCAGAIVLVLRADASRRPAPFASTIAEFEHDLRLLRTPR